MILAEISDAVWLALIGVGSLAVKEYFDRQRGIAATAAVQATADKVEVVHKATNSMKDELVKEVRTASFAAGQKDQKDKESK